jgi:hypothetical protein
MAQRGNVRTKRGRRPTSFSGQARPAQCPRLRSSTTYAPRYRTYTTAPAGGLSCSECRPRARPVQVRASHCIPVFDVAQCNVAPVAKQSAHAIAARPVLRRAAPVVVVHMDELPLRKQLAAHPAGIRLPTILHPRVNNSMGQTFEKGGRNRVRTCDPSLVRRNRTVWARRLVSHDVPASWADRLGASAGAAQHLGALAPRLAPRNLVRVAKKFPASLLSSQ